MKLQQLREAWRRSFWLRRSPLLVAVGLGALLLFREATHDVELVYDVSSIRDDLQGFSVGLAPQGAGVVRQTRFSRPSAGWTANVSHTVGLAPGKYRATIVLEYPASSPSIERDFELDRDTKRLVLFLSR